jgi:hypothetical protein
MSNTALKLVQSNPEVASIDKEMELLQAKLNALKAEKKEKTKGIAIKLNKYTKDNVEFCGVQLLGLSSRPILLFRDQIMRLVDDTPEAEANRKFIREFVAANEAQFTRKK